MKRIFFAVGLAAFLLTGSYQAGAQVYQPYTYAPYWGNVPYQPYPYPQQYDPYYDLHVMHYQLYLQPYPGYPAYPPFVSGVVPFWSPPVITTPPVIIAPRRHPLRRR